MVQPALVVHVADHLADAGDTVFAFTAAPHAIHPVAKFPQPLQSCRGYLVHADAAAGLAQATVVGGGEVAQCFQRGGAQLAAGYVGDAQEGVVIVLVHHQAQVGHDVLYLVAGEKGGAAAEVVGHLLLLQRQLDQPRLVVAPV